MAYIEVNNDLAGIRSLMAFSPETANPLNQLANALLRTEEDLPMAERELIATYVSYLNDCFYCQHAHGAIACEYLNGDEALVEWVKKDFPTAPISEKLKALLAIAGSVQKGGKQVKPEQIEKARAEGATDKDIHDTVLIAAAFCMYNRYVDGLEANTPKDISSYPARARQVVQNGYGTHIFFKQQPAISVPSDQDQKVKK